MHMQYAMASSGRKVVQTELDEKAYLGLVDAAARKDLSIKDALRAAVSEWTRRNLDLSNDPFFKLKPFRWKHRRRGEDIDKAVYGGRPD
jgi:hypothetical protein